MDRGRQAEVVTLWVLRALWTAIPFTVGDALASTLHDVDSPIRATGSVIAWTGWAAGVVACAVPRVLTLTCLRTVVPAALAGAVWAALDDLDASAVAGLSIAGAAMVLSLSSVIADRFVDGSSYGAERRLNIKVPPALLVGPIPLTWAVVVASSLTGPLLLAARRWLAGGVATAVGLVLAGIGARALNQLSRRWMVFVPAGLVVHDHLALREPMLLPRNTIASLGPARAGTEATAVDLTCGAAGLLVHLDLASPVALPIARRDDTTTTSSILLAPGRPGVAVAEAAARRIAIS